MFLNNTIGIPYMTSGSVIPDSVDCLKYAAIPHSYGQDFGGIGLVAQYVEGYKFKTDSVCQMKSDLFDAIREKAYEIDQTNSNIEEYSDTYPSAGGVMQAFIDLEYVKNASGVGYVKAQTDDIKYFMRQYGGLILEMKLTDQTYNAYNWKIDAPGTVLNENFTKGFIAVGYDATNIYLQNSLGICAGSLGFHQMPWTVAEQLVVKGLVFRLDNPS